MIRIIRWFRRYRGRPVATCVICDTELIDCARCAGRWSQARCDQCLQGSICPTHRRHRF